MTDIAAQVKAIRSSVGLSRPSCLSIVQVDGPTALDVLQTVCTQSPYIREGRVRHTLLLRDDASIFADAFVVKVDDSFVVIAEGPTESELAEWVSARAGKVQCKGSEWSVFSIDGPYAWEATSRLLGPAVLGLPYLTLMRRDDILCVRAGKTGEYGYLLLVPSSAAAGVESQLSEIGPSLDMCRISQEALDVCALENWHFSMRTMSSSLTPIELQLQWRVSYERTFVGAEALRARRAEGPKVRATCFVASGNVARGDRLSIGDVDVGEVLASCASPSLGMVIGSALLDIRFAHPHLTLTTNGTSLRTSTSILVDNLSLRVDPHKHSYATRS